MSKRTNICILIMVLLSGASALQGCKGDEKPVLVPKPPEIGNFKYPLGIIESGGKLYVSDLGNSTIREVSIAGGNVITIAGSAGKFGASDNTAGVNALFNSPRYLAISSGNLYVAGGLDRGIRSVDTASPYGVITHAGTLGRASSADSTNGAGNTVFFSEPHGIALNGTTELYVLDLTGNKIRHVDIDDTSGTLAGAGNTVTMTVTFPAGVAFSKPYGMAACNDELFITNSGDSTVLQLSSVGDTTSPMIASVLAGMSGKRGSADGAGNAARFNGPTGITCGAGNLYVTDTGNSTVREIEIASASVKTLAGKAGQAGAVNGIGSAARFFWPFGITSDGTNLYVADTYNHIIRSIVISTGYVDTVAGMPGEPGSIDIP